MPLSIDMRAIARVQVVAWEDGEWGTVPSPTLPRCWSSAGSHRENRRRTLDHPPSGPARHARRRDHPLGRQQGLRRADLARRMNEHQGGPIRPSRCDRTAAPAPLTRCKDAGGATLAPSAAPVWELLCASGGLSSPSSRQPHASTPAATAARTAYRHNSIEPRYARRHADTSP